MALYKSIFIYIRNKFWVKIEISIQKAINVRVRILLLLIETFRTFLASLSLLTREKKLL